MPSPTTPRRRAWLAAATPAALLGGCDWVVLNPAGDIARRQADLVLASTGLMLLIVVPVLVLIAVFAWRYRRSSTTSKFAPDWDHSIQLELVIWAAPLLIIIALGLMTWITTHTLDPYRRLDRIDAQRPLDASVRPLVVEVVSMDWKWLFIYPEQGIASVNEMAAPVDRPLDFRLTSTTMMNSFYVPAMAGQIYTMAGMQTRLHAIVNRTGDFDGFSANYSGAGFSHMRFRLRSMDEAGFGQWVAQVRATPERLDRTRYVALARPSEREPVRHFGQVDPALFHAVLNRCVEAGQTCIEQWMGAPNGGRSAHGAAHGASHGGNATMTGHDHDRSAH